MTSTSTSRIGVLLVNLGTPDAPTAAALRPYLQQFLSDPRVVEIPRAVWMPILHGVILRTRPAQSAKKYATIWTPEGSPLQIHTAQQTKLLRGYLSERLKDTPFVVEYAMRYGNPSIAHGLAKLQSQHCDRILVLPLYPQYAASSTASTIDEVLNVLATERNQPALRTVKHFHDHPGYIAALAQNVRDYWTNNGFPDQLVMSFHGVPKFTHEKGDPYYNECLVTGKLLAAALKLREDQYEITFQSRFGRAEWLKPYTAATLEELGKQKTKRVDVFCPGFVADCLETLEEIGMEVRTSFLNAGGGEYHHIPCLNERADWIHALADITVNELQGWK